MRKLLVLFALPLMGFGCGPALDAQNVSLGEDVDWGARNAPWEVDPCADFRGDGSDLQEECSADDTWSMVDNNVHSATMGQEVRPDTLGKVSLWAYYWANCGTCVQQLAFLQVLKDELTGQGYDVEMVGVAYRSADIGQLGASPRAASGACQGPRSSYASCVQGENDMIKLTIPVVLDPGRVSEMHGVERGDWFIYRPDGRLHRFVRSEEREAQNGFLGNATNWNWLIEELKAAAMTPYGGKEPCSAQHECSDPDQWCQFPDGQCGGQGACVTTLLPARSNQSVGSVSSVCGADVAPQWVCGCDGVSYRSRCLAEVYRQTGEYADERSGNISHLGRCEVD